MQRSIKRFQHFHHIDTTGIIGVKTRAILNQRINQQIRNVEWNINQWQKSELTCSENFIYINIAGCHLKVIDNQKINQNQNAFK